MVMQVNTVWKNKSRIDIEKMRRFPQKAFSFFRESRQIDYWDGGVAARFLVSVRCPMGLFVGSDVSIVALRFSEESEDDLDLFRESWVGGFEDLSHMRFVL